MKLEIERDWFRWEPMKGRGAPKKAFWKKAGGWT